MNVQSVTFVSSTQLDVQIKVHKRAAGGLRDVTITNPDNSTATRVGGFTVGTTSANSASSAQSSGPAQSSNLSSNDETSTETSIDQPTDPTLLIVELAWAEEEPDDESPIENDTEIIATTDQTELDSLFGDLDDSLQEELLAV